MSKLNVIRVQHFGRTFYQTLSRVAEVKRSNEKVGEAQSLQIVACGRLLID